MLLTRVDYPRTCCRRKDLFLLLKLAFLLLQSSSSSVYFPRLKMALLLLPEAYFTILLYLQLLPQLLLPGSEPSLHFLVAEVGDSV